MIRVSGNGAWKIARGIFRRGKGSALHAPTPNLLYHGWLLDGENAFEEAMLCCFKAPKSFTAEDSVEINCHGSPQVVSRVLGILSRSGCRLAEPGEFTRRALINGRIDLSRAEAVNDLIQAKTAEAAQVAANNLKGELYGRIENLKNNVRSCLALINAEIDFADEDLSFIENPELFRRMDGIESWIRRLAEDAETGTVLREGYLLALIGRPNSGKSSLMNAMLKKDRAIVADVPGTTRDSIEEYFVVDGLPFKIIDTAGIRETDDAIEAEGIRRALEVRDRADLTLWVIDSTLPRFDDADVFLDRGRT